jgi:aspartate beta-hydroxylase
MKAELAPRKALFFDIVESGLNDRFKEDDVPRVFKFCQYAKNEIPAPSAKVMMHDPCEEYIDDLEAKPWWNKEQFEWVAGLEAQSSIIGDELRDVLAARELFKGDSRYQGTMGEGWTAFRLQRLGQWNEENVKVFPKTSAIIRSLNIPLAVRGVMFAKQAPGSGVQPHSDGRNFILTSHLGVTVPKVGCSITVGGEKRGWEQDKCLVFDTSFTHETANDSEEDRYVVIIDFWHPDLSLDERLALDFIYDSRNKFESDKTDEIDCTYVNDGRPTDLTGIVMNIIF